MGVGPGAQSTGGSVGAGPGLVARTWSGREDQGDSSRLVGPQLGQGVRAGPGGRGINGGTGEAPLRLVVGGWEGQQDRDGSHLLGPRLGQEVRVGLAGLAGQGAQGEQGAQGGQGLGGGGAGPGPIAGVWSGGQDQSGTGLAEAGGQFTSPEWYHYAAPGRFDEQHQRQEIISSSNVEAVRRGWESLPGRSP